MSRAVQEPRSSDNPLDITLAHLFANEALFMPVSHVLEQLVRRKERLVAKLIEVSHADQLENSSADRASFPRPTSHIG